MSPIIHITPRIAIIICDFTNFFAPCSAGSFSSFNSAVILDFPRFSSCFKLSLRITLIFRIFRKKKKGAKCPRERKIL